MDFKAQFFKVLEEKEISQNTAARQMGYSSGSILSQWKAGSYEGNVAQLEKAASWYLGRLHSQGALRKAGFVPTAFFRQIYSAINQAHELKTCAFIVGPAGIGKTLTLRRYAGENRNVYIIEGERGMSENALVRSLAAQCNIKGRYSYEVKEALIAHLAGTNALIAVDEANYLNPLLLDALRRTFYDQGEIPLLFIGARALMNNIFLNPRDYQQLQRRIGIYLDLSGKSLPQNETAAIVKTLFPNAQTDHIKQIAETARRNPHLTAALAERCHRLTLNNGAPLSPEIIEEARKSIFLTARR